MEMAVFWDVALCTLVENYCTRKSRKTYRIKPDKVETCPEQWMRGMGRIKLRTEQTSVLVD
jgi:hypothetical protein